MRGVWRGAVVAAVVVPVLVLSLCPRPSRTSKPIPLAPEVAAIVSAFTGGTISREGAVRVVFAEPVGGEATLNEPLADSPFDFEPGIEGVAVWTAPTRLEFRPSARLDEGRQYRARLDLEKLLGKAAPAPHFEFDFAAMKQSFTVSVDGLLADDARDIARQRLMGRLVTADVEAEAGIERVLAASQEGRDLEIAWEHQSDRRTHVFVVQDVVRQNAPSALTLRWNGAPIGVAEASASQIEVPTLDTFAVSQARAVQGQEQFVELRFTDPLLPDQNLRGLIGIGNRNDLRLAIQGNVVEVYGTRGFSGEQTLRVEAGVRNSLGYRMRERQELTVRFEQRKPQLRFASDGVVVPTSANLTVPLEAVNLRAVTVQATRVTEGNLPQFFQVNDLDGDRQMNRVGRVVWRKTLPLDTTADKRDRWISVGLDLSPLVEAAPGGLYRLTLSFDRRHVIWPCGDEPVDELTSAEASADGELETSNWDSWAYDAEDWQSRYQGRHDPCNPGYYQHFYDHDIRVSRNVLVSDVGLTAKAGQDGKLIVIATDLRTASPLVGAGVTLRDYQHASLATATTDVDGIAHLEVERAPFLAVVESGGQTGYLRLDDGSALSLAHFDVAGSRSQEGLKGFLYGERGVWRPGDTMHLTFILHDPAGRVGDEHPVLFELINPRGQVVKTVTRAGSTDGFSSFEVATPQSAPTGNYVGRVTVGGALFEKTLKVETVMPNRLKLALEFGRAWLRAGDSLAGELSSAWLHGAPARHLNAQVEVGLRTRGTRFDGYQGYSFDDPTRRYDSARQEVFSGALDAAGRASVDATLEVGGLAPGMLQADFTTRVFEPGGAFSTDRFSVPVSPFERYIGIRAPRGDRARGMLLTDTPHQLDIVAVDAEGQAALGGEVELKLYKVDWRWWWQRGEDNLAAWADATVHTPLASDVLSLVDGVATWSFQINQPDWGRYLITASDRDGRHRTGTVIYIDWPGWAGRGRKESDGASVLTFSAEREEYEVGDAVTLVIPTAQQGRALVSLETGASVLHTEWIEATGRETRYRFRASPEMAPTVYAHVTLLQPHAQTTNDLPMRLYGVTPIKVLDPETRLRPVVESADVFTPESTARIAVRETDGLPMTYTLAVVDQGLLGLTRHKTPNPWDHFYAREALGVKTWDLYDDVVGAWGGVLERMLAIGGDEEGVQAEAQRANRFPPMVRFLGPFRLAPGATDTHEVDVPQYVGAVRVMVVAGHDGAFGAADREAFVRRPLMLLATLPRVLGPQEEVALPVSVFAMEPSVKAVSVKVAVKGPIETMSGSHQSLSFDAVGDQLVSFRLRSPSRLGVASVTIEAISGSERAAQTIELDVRPSTRRIVDVVGTTLEAGATWQPRTALPGMSGTNEATLEVSRTPPIDLGRRLEYLMRYPHGCAEQTTSGALPQLFLGKLLELTPDKQTRIESNVRKALTRLRSFQTSGGGFGTWPGDDDANDWISNYAGHFVMEAKAAGYLAPTGMIEQWISFQRRRARAWVPGPGRAELTQAYRLYGLALADTPELAAMNQLRERPDLPVAARWRLAAAYGLAGQPEAAADLASSERIGVTPYREQGRTFGSAVRDRAMILEALLVLRRSAAIGPLVQSLSATLSANEWLSTQETAFALLALAKSMGDGPSEETTFSFSWQGGASTGVSSTSPMWQGELDPGAEQSAALRVENTGSTRLYPRMVLSGLPALGRETASANGLRLQVEYKTMQGANLDPTRLDQGTDFKAVVSVTSSGELGRYEQLALTHVVASGWEIHNERLGPAGPRRRALFGYQDVRDDRVYTYFDLRAGETKAFELLLNASYLGHFYLPPVSVEAMYDATINGRTTGRWVEVARAGN